MAPENEPRTPQLTSDHVHGRDPATAASTAGLPAVQPPSASFIVGLFLIPGLIVGVMVLVYVLFGKVAGGHRNPEDYLKDLKSSNHERRWLAARELASVLPHNPEWQENEDLAKALAQEFESSLNQGASDELELQYQKYLAVALGESNSPTVLAVLRKATSPGIPQEVRWAAIASLGGVGQRLSLVEDPSLHSALAAAVHDLAAVAKDDDPALRTLAAFALRSIDQPQSVDGLRPLLFDSNHEVRYNAACSLAHLGSSEGLDTLQEMLQLNREHLRVLGVRESQLNAVLEAELVAALDALSALVRRHPATDVAAMQSLIQSHTGNSSRRVRTSAQKLLIHLGH
jgi:HEAT repeat protein